MLIKPEITSVRRPLSEQSQGRSMKNREMLSAKRLALFQVMIFLPALLLLVQCNNKEAPEKKQIILISIDTLRGDHLNSYGYFRETTLNLSKLIEDSVYFTQAYPNGCWTMPSHMSLLTGTLPSRHGINIDWKSYKKNKYTKLSDSIKSIPEVLKSYNINTIKFARLPGELGFNKGFGKDYGVDPFLNDERFDKILQELENYKKGNFFFFIHTWMVHAPYSNCYFVKEKIIDEKLRSYINNFREVGKKTKFITTDFQNFLIKNKLYDTYNCIALYDSGIRYVDRYIGRIIKRSKQLGVYDNLMFIVVSDHGEHFEEHYPGFFYDYHGKDYYEEFIKVPLIIKYPKDVQPEIIDHPVSLIDVLPTILDYYEIEIPTFVQGDSLLKPRSEKNKKYIISEAISEPKIERKMIRFGDLKYIITMQNPSKPERVNWHSISERRLFNLKNDPLENDNLYKKLKFRRICTNLEKMLHSIIKNSASTHLPAKETKISEKTLDLLRSLGYLN